VCWNTSSNPTTKNYKAISGTILEMFPSNLTNLTPSTTYYLRAFASNTSETGYGNEVSFTTKSLEKASIQTNEIVSMTANSIVYSGKILSSGGSPLIERGACCSSNQNPTVDDNKNISPLGLDAFIGKVTNLMANQTYYLRVYAINSIGISYGNQISFSTCNCDQVIDKDGNVYNTVQIGTQIWMMENLKSTIFNDGDSISFITDVYSWAYTSAPAYSWYNNDKEFKNPYGALYNWYVVFTGKLCPLGWHVPTYENFKILVDYLGGKDIAGGKLKDIGSGDWTYPNAGATNESGFTGLPSGNYGGFVDVSDGMGNYGYWWSSTEATTINSYSLTLRRRAKVGPAGLNRTERKENARWAFLAKATDCHEGSSVHVFVQNPHN
jgi:Fibrobacter succinogenes major domain (Fib_succ_major).